MAKSPDPTPAEIVATLIDVVSRPVPPVQPTPPASAAEEVAEEDDETPDERHRREAVRAFLGG